MRSVWIFFVLQGLQHANDVFKASRRKVAVGGHKPCGLAAAFGPAQANAPGAGQVIHLLDALHRGEKARVDIFDGNGAVYLAVRRAHG